MTVFFEKYRVPYVRVAMRTEECYNYFDNVNQFVIRRTEMDDNLGDWGEECENCECIVCLVNDESICDNCTKCSGNKGYSRWKMKCLNLTKLIIQNKQFHLF